MFYFLLFGQGRGPRPNSKNETPEEPKQQKIPDNKKVNTLTASLACLATAENLPC